MAWEPNIKQKRDLFTYFQAAWGKKEISQGNMNRGKLLYSRLSDRFKRALGEQYEELCNLDNPVQFVKLLNKPLSETADEMEKGPEEESEEDVA